MADTAAERARGAGAEVSMKRVAESVPPDVLAKSGAETDRAAPLASPQELDRYDAIIVGSPTRCGRMAAQMAQFRDKTGGLRSRNALVGKVGSAFTSTASQRGPAVLGRRTCEAGRDHRRQGRAAAERE